MTHIYHQARKGWDVLYNPESRKGQIQHTADESTRSVKWTATRDGKVNLPQGHGVPAEVVAALRAWVAAGAPDNSDPLA